MRWPCASRQGTPGSAIQADQELQQPRGARRQLRAAVEVARLSDRVGLGWIGADHSADFTQADPVIHGKYERLNRLAGMGRLEGPDAYIESVAALFELIPDARTEFLYTGTRDRLYGGTP